MKEIFSEKSAVVYDWTGAAEDKSKAGSAVKIVDSSPYMISARAIPFTHFVGPDNVLELGHFDAEAVVSATVNYILDNNLKTMDFDDLAEHLRAQFDQAGSYKGEITNISHSPYNPDNVEIVLSMIDTKILNEEPNAEEIGHPQISL